MITELFNVLSGGVVGTVVDAIKTYFPPSMSDKEKAELELALTRLAAEKDKQLAEMGIKAEAEFNSRIKEMEGTASDLKAVPLVGSVVLFLRGVQRPAWGFAVLYFDYMVFAKQWIPTQTQESMLLAVNLLVLGFLFGERAVKNVAPLLERFFQRPSS